MKKTWDFDEFVRLTEEGNWTATCTKNDVVVDGKSVEGSALKIARGKTVAKCDMAAVVALVEDAARRGEWDTLTVKTTVPRVIDDRSRVVYMQSIAQFPASARDFCTEVRAAERGDGSFVQICNSQEPGKEDVPNQKGFVRGQTINSGFVIRQIGEKQTEIVYIMCLDLCGWLPTALVNKVMADGPLALAKLREIAEKDASK